MSNQQQEIDTYWNINKVLGEGDIKGQQFLIRLKLHRSDETYYYPNEIFPLSSPRGNKVYFHAKPYILIPKLTFTVALSRPKADTGEIGKVIGSNMQELQQRDIGNAQAWYVRRIGACLDPVRSTEGSRRTKHTCFWQHP
jgi:hypothetical protein